MFSQDSVLGSYPVVLAEGEGFGLRLRMEEAMSLFGFAQAADHNVIVVGGQNSTPRSTLHFQRSIFYFFFSFETKGKATIAVGQLRNGFRKRSGPSSAATKSAQLGWEHSIFCTEYRIQCSLCMS